MKTDPPLTPTKAGGNGIMPILRPPSPERWSPPKGSAVRQYLFDQIDVRMLGGRLGHAALMEELKELVTADNPKAYVPSERLVFNFIRREQEKLKR